MSDSARYHATKQVEGLQAAEIRELIDTLENARPNRGCEFDDARSRHKTATRLEVFRTALANAELAQALANCLTAEQLADLGENLIDGLAGIDSEIEEGRAPGLNREQAAGARLMSRLADALLENPPTSNIGS